MAVELIEANASVGHPFRIALRGRANEAYLKKILNKRGHNTGSMGLVEILPIVDNSKMVSEAAKHDVLFGSNPASNCSISSLLAIRCSLACWQVVSCW